METRVTHSFFRRALRGALAAAAALAAAQAALAQDAALQVRSWAATCAACHGTDGKAVAGGAMARLAGMDARTTAEQLRAFRDGKRPATVMHQIAKGYSDAQIDALAAFFAAQK